MSEKYIDLSVLKRRLHSRYGEIIDWKSSEGITLNFQYEQIKGTVKIIKYIDGKNILIEINNEQYRTSPERVRKCEFGCILGLYGHDYIYNVGEIVHKEKSDFLILEQCSKIVNNTNGWKKKAYKYKCITCGNIDIIAEQDLKKCKCCACCANQKIVRGINDMWTTAPEIAKMLWNKEDGYKYTKSCNKMLDWKCPTCGTKIPNKNCNQIFRQGYVSCPRCSDGISYPNKLIYNLFLNIGELPKREVYFDWLPNCPYDIVIENKKIIVEMDGWLGHGGRTFHRDILDTDGRIHDVLKDNLAEKNGYRVIRIDCRYYGVENRLQYIKENILNSELVNIFDFNSKNIDWDIISKESEKSYVYNACKLYKNGITKTKDIAEKLNIHYATVIQYLKRGNKYNWCDYNPKKSHKESISNKCMCIETNEHFLSYKSAAEKYKLPHSSTTSMITKISKNCKGITSDIGCNNILHRKLSFISEQKPNE